MEAIGHLQLYGLTPCINFFDKSGLDLEADDRDLNILVSETADLRHVMKSLADVCPLKKARQHKLNIYLHEKNFECLARDLLFLTLFCETGLSKRERQEMFIDLYGNTCLTSKSDGYLQGVLNELI